jgi:hypothetical protein
MRASRVVLARHRAFAHNYTHAPLSTCSIDGIAAFLHVMPDAVDEISPPETRTCSSTEHIRRRYRPGEPGIVKLNLNRLGDCVMMRLKTFGNALMASGGVCSENVRRCTY